MRGQDRPPSVASGGRPILYLCRSGYVPHSRRFCCTQGKHWCIGTLAHAGGQRHRGHGGCAIGIGGLVNTQRTGGRDPEVDDVITVTLAAFKRSET